MDKLIIKGAEALCRIGVSKKERSRKQRIIVDAEIGFNAVKAANTDKIEDTIDYLDVYGIITKVAGKKEYSLIETLAESIAKNILADFDAKSACIRVRKPSAFPKGKAEYAAVEITRHNG